jgi:hypothetical protein
MSSWIIKTVVLQKIKKERFKTFATENFFPERENICVNE